MSKRRLKEEVEGIITFKIWHNTLMILVNFWMQRYTKKRYANVHILFLLTFFFKFPELEKLEEQVHDLVASETEIILSRHWQDNADDLLLFADIQQLDEEMEEEENVDEFGRVKELRNSDAARRRRKEERKQRMSRQADLAEESVEDLIKEQGLWTDDEMQDDEQKDNKLQAIETAGIEALMEDVSEEFRSLGAVKEKFEAWKTTYYEDYQKAFGSLSLPGAFEFYIRLELITWNPFLVCTNTVMVCNIYIYCIIRIQQNLIVWNGIRYYQNTVYHQNMKTLIRKC